MIQIIWEMIIPWDFYNWVWLGLGVLYVLIMLNEKINPWIPKEGKIAVRCLILKKWIKDLMEALTVSMAET